jgi:hypothetical protein
MIEHLITTSKSVAEIADEFESDNIAIPEIQRDVVWKADQIKSLIDSISNQYPCGSLIYWEPREKDKSLVRSMIRPERVVANQGRVPRYFLIDGQQRVTALASVLLNRHRVRELLAEIQDDLPYVFVNVKNFEFESTTDPTGYSYPWIVFNKLFDGSYRSEPGFSGLPADDVARIQKYVQRIRDYKFPVQIVRDQKYQTVGDIFTRVNSAGTQLTGAEIHLARIVPHWNGITREFRDYRHELTKKRFDLDLTFLMRAITVIECNTPQIKKLADTISKDRPSRVHLNKTWRQARSAIDYSIRVMQRDLKLDKSKYVTSKNALVPVVYSFAKAKRARPLERDAVRFFVLAQLSEHYGGSGETTLRKDFRGLTDTDNTPKQGMAELVDAVRKEAKREYRGLRVKADDVYGVGSKNVLVLLMYILMRETQATDWGSGKRIQLADIESRDLQLHHIFPFDYMQKNRDIHRWYEKQGYAQSYFRSEVNDIANLTFLSRTKNIDIKETPPSVYLPIETTKAMRKAHFIPERPDLWKTENFAKFLEARRELLAVAMTRLLKRL